MKRLALFLALAIAGMNIVACSSEDNSSAIEEVKPGENPSDSNNPGDDGNNPGDDGNNPGDDGNNPGDNGNNGDDDNPMGGEKPSDGTISNPDEAVGPSTTDKAPMSGMVNLWTRGNIPATTKNANNSDGADFIPNMEVFTVGEETTPKGAVVICPGGAFMFRSIQNEGYDVANMLTRLGYQCFVVNYRISPYTMQESATDLQRAIRYVRAHATDYRINPQNIALVGFSAGGILNGEVLLNWRDLKNGTSLDANYQPDALDNIPVSVCAVGMIYSFYGRLSVSMNNVATLRAANLPPAFYCWGTRDGFAGQFTQNSNAVREAGCQVQTKILQNYPHGYGTGGNASVWGNDFDAFLTPIMNKNN